MKKYMKNLHLPMFWGNLFKNRLLQAAVHENVHEKPSFGNVLRELIEKQVTSTRYIIPWRLRCPWSIWFCFSLTVKNACTQTESTLSWQRSLSYRNQPVHWFALWVNGLGTSVLYDGGVRHKRVKQVWWRFLQKLVIYYCKKFIIAKFISLLFTIIAAVSYYCKNAA